MCQGTLIFYTCCRTINEINVEPCWECHRAGKVKDTLVVAYYPICASCKKDLLGKFRTMLLEDGRKKWREKKWPELAKDDDKGKAGQGVLFEDGYQDKQVHQDKQDQPESPILGALGIKLVSEMDTPHHRIPLIRVKDWDAHEEETYQVKNPQPECSVSSSLGAKIMTTGFGKGEDEQQQQQYEVKEVQLLSPVLGKQEAEIMIPQEDTTPGRQVRMKLKYDEEEAKRDVKRRMYTNHQLPEYTREANI